jgi:hypothetical protein
VQSTSNQPISGVNVRLFEDFNADGLADSGSAIRSVFTPSDGSYAMANLTPGHYVIVQTQPAGWTSFDDGDSSDDGDVVPNIDSLDNLIPLTLTLLEVDSMNIFKESPMPGQISGSVFNDLNSDQFPDPGEGIPNVTLNAFADANTDGVADSGTPVFTVMTNAQGQFLFPNVAVGHYVLVEVQPASMISIKDFDASNDGDVVPNTIMLDDIIPVSITLGELDAHNYFIDAPSCGLTVTNTNDNGVGSFRDALSCGMNGDTIRFHNSLAGATIEINSSVLSINKELVILSTLTPRVTIKSTITGLFDIQVAGIVECRDMNIISGLSPGGTGAAFENYGLLKLHNMVVLRNPLFVSGEYLIRNHTNSEAILSGNCFIQKD